MRQLLFIATAAVLAACSGSHEHAGEGIEISNARIYAPLPRQTTAAAFMRLDNYGAPDKLLSVSAPVSDRVEIHTHLNEGGVMKMRRVDGIDLPHGETIELKPGSFHVMIFETDIVVGDEVVLTLDFETADDLTVVAPVTMRGEKTGGDESHGSHSGH